MQWHIALTQPGKDKQAGEALLKREYPVYRPIIPKSVIDRHHRMNIRWVSMFPGYLFVLPHARGWEMLRTAPGLRIGEYSLMRNRDGTFATIDGNHPDFIRIQRIERELSMEAVMAESPENPLKAGDWVKINDGGAFHGQWKEIQSLDDAGRICLLLDLLGRTWPAHFEPQHLISA